MSLPTNDDSPSFTIWEGPASEAANEGPPPHEPRGDVSLDDVFREWCDAAPPGLTRFVREHLEYGNESRDVASTHCDAWPIARRSK